MMQHRCEHCAAATLEVDNDSCRSIKGLSFVGRLLVSALVVVATSTACKLMPHYFDYWSMKNIISSVETDKALEMTTVSDFYSHVSKGMQVNSIQDLDLNKALSVTAVNDPFIAHLNDEKRLPLIRNIELLVTFDHLFSVAKP